MAVDVSMKIRLDKYLADMGFGTRSQVKQQIARGSVTVNGSSAVRPELKIETDSDTVFYCGVKAAYEQYEYFMLNKPAGVVSATEDKKERTVLDLLQERKRKDLFPVGRLDKDTEGLLLITNDGNLAHRLLAPGKHVDKVYYAEIDGKVTREDAEHFLAGVDIGDEKKTIAGGPWDSLFGRRVQGSADDPGRPVPSGETNVSCGGKRSAFSEADSDGFPEAG